MDVPQLIKIVEKLASLPNETEWVEFKHNFHSEEEIGERLSGLSNSAALLNEPYGYLVFGVEDGTHKIIGTNFKGKQHKKGNEEVEMWLLNRLNPRIDIECYEFLMDDKNITLYRIPAATSRPVTFLNNAYIRIGSLTKPLKNYPDKEAKLWSRSVSKELDKNIIKECDTASEIVKLLSVETYFDKLDLPMPQTIDGIIERFISEKFVIPLLTGYGITELGAILLAKNLRDFQGLHRKAVRAIVYKGKNKVETIRDQVFEQGYAISLPDVIEWVNGQLPANEEIGRVLRDDVRMYPEIAIREISANMIIHQDMSMLGFPMIEIYSDRVEISSPGQPLISTDRFIDEYQSRNEDLADIMRRMHFCEEKGSGMDKALAAIEKYQLPPIKFRISDIRTTIILSAYKKWGETTKDERVQAAYQHACLKYMSNEMLTNKSLRERFGLEEKNYPQVSIIIKEALSQGLIKIGTPQGTNRRDIAYIPSWG